MLSDEHKQLLVGQNKALDAALSKFTNAYLLTEYSYKRAKRKDADRQKLSVPIVSDPMHPNFSYEGKMFLWDITKNDYRITMVKHLRKTKNTPYWGVKFDDYRATHYPWRAIICPVTPFFKRKIEVGMFKTANQAAEAYNKIQVLLFGAAAILNPIKEIDSSKYYHKKPILNRTVLSREQAIEQIRKNTNDANREDNELVIGIINGDSKSMNIAIDKYKEDWILSINRSRRELLLDSKINKRICHAYLGTDEMLSVGLLDIIRYARMGRFSGTKFITWSKSVMRFAVYHKLRDLKRKSAINKKFQYIKMPDNIYHDYWEKEHYEDSGRARAI